MKPERECGSSVSVCLCFADQSSLKIVSPRHQIKNKNKITQNDKKKENIGGRENCNLHDIFWSAQVRQPRTDDFLAPRTLLECRKHLIGYKTSGACECNEQCTLQTNDILKGIPFFHVTSATLDWLLNTPNPTQRASTCSPSSRRTSKTHEKTPTKVRAALILQIQKVEGLIPTSICQPMAGEMERNVLSLRVQSLLSQCPPLSMCCIKWHFAQFTRGWK